MSPSPIDRTPIFVRGVEVDRNAVPPLIIPNLKKKKASPIFPLTPRIITSPSPIRTPREAERSSSPIPTPTPVRTPREAERSSSPIPTPTPVRTPIPTPTPVRTPIPISREVEGTPIPIPREVVGTPIPIPREVVGSPSPGVVRSPLLLGRRGEEGEGEEGEGEKGEGEEQVRSQKRIVYVVKKRSEELSRMEKESRLADISVKMDKIRVAYPNITVRPIPEEADYETANDIYNTYVKHTKVCNIVSKYDNYTKWFYKIIGLAGAYFGISIPDCYESLCKESEYQELLNELGEKNIPVDVGGTVRSKWGPEVRFAFLAITVAIVAVLEKFLTSFVGSTIASSAANVARGVLKGGEIPNASSMGSMLGGIGDMIGPLLSGLTQQPTGVKVSREPLFDE